MIPIEQQIKCVKRELGMRQRLYPRWVAIGKIKGEKARMELMEMNAVLETLKALTDSAKQQALSIGGSSK